ncbi:TPA: hypothetical protein ACG3DQ_004532, partial [Pseudomonas putida]
MVELVSSDPEKLEEYCQAKFGKSWLSIRCDAEQDLATRLIVIADRIPPLEALLIKGQPPETLVEAYDDIDEALLGAYGDGSLKAVVLMGHLSTIGSKFPPLAKPGAGIVSFQAAADMGYIAAYCFLGDHLLKEGRAVEAATAYQQGAQKGCSACLYQLGQFTERGVGGLVQSDRAAFDLYLQAAEGNYPPADVAMAKLWLRSPQQLPKPSNLGAVLRERVEMSCDGAEVTLAELYLHFDNSAQTMREVLSLYRCAAAYGDVEAQMKLARLLAGIESAVQGALALNLQVDADEAEKWYLRVCGSQYASRAQVARANFELGQLFISNGKYAQAAGHFQRACNYVPEAVNQQLKCERYAEAWFSSQGGGIADD